MPRLLAPEAGDERPAHAPGLAGEPGRGLVLAEQQCPRGHALERKVPQCIDLDRLADARCHYPVATFGVHPGQLNVGNAGAQQPVGRVHANAVAGAASMPVDDVAQRRIQVAQQRVVAARLQVGIDGVEVPQRRVYRVVFRWFAAIREAIRQHALADMNRERAQYRAGVGDPASGQCQAR